MKSSISILLVSLFAAGAHAQQLVAFTESASLLKSQDVRAGMADCQPLRGDTAQVLATAKGGGAELAQVQVLSGHCEGARGWTGFPRLAAAQAARPDGGVRFSESSSLLKSADTSQGMAECQPLRGDTVRMIEVGKGGGAHLARVEVTSGRCAGREGWTGLPRLETGAGR